MLREWSDLPSEDDREAARDLFEEIERLSSRLAKAETELGELVGREPDMQVPAMPDVAAMLVKFRKDRNKLFPRMFGEPAWDILLSLGALNPAKPAVPVSSIGYAAEVPLSTTLRYLAMLETAGLVERSAHPEDGRSFLIQLTPLGRERLQLLFEKWPLMLLVAAVPLTLLVRLFFW